MDRRPPYHHGDLKETILQLARTEIEESGIENLSLRGLAQRAGVSKMAPYRHFSGIEELLGLVAAEAMEDLADAMEAQVVQTPTDSGLMEALGRTYIDFALGRPKLFRFLFSLQGTQLSSPACVQAGQRAQRALAAAAAYGDRTPQELEISVAANWAYVHGLAVLLLEGLIDREFFEAHWSDFLGAGIGKIAR